MSTWTEHRNPEGRTYWFHPATKQSVWEKPDELKTSFERALNQTKWKEYFSGGRKYYYNTETKDSKWDMPEELVALLEKVEQEGTSTLAAIPKALPPATSTPSADLSPATPNSLQVGMHTGGVPTPTPIPTRPNLPEDPIIPHNGFHTFEEGEKAFMHLLRKAGVDGTWTWEQTMRAIITDPLYKALNTLAEKKATYEKFIVNLRAKEQEEKEARLAKLRPQIRNMLKGNPNVFHYSTFPTADKLFSQHPIWQQARVEAERKVIFEEYVSELKQREIQESRASRARSTAKLVSMFKAFDVDVTTRWRTAYELIQDSEEWNTDPDLRKLPELDILLAFEDYSRVKEREYDERTRREQIEKTRSERKAREAFKALLEELVSTGHIKARTKWKQIFPRIQDEAAYNKMLGNPGSNQLELFWDVVDRLDQELDKKIDVVLAAIADYNAKVNGDNGTEADGDIVMGNGAEEKPKEPGFIVSPETTAEEFTSVLKNCTSPALETLTPDDLVITFESLRDAAIKKRADEKKKAERKARHLQDDLRYALKKLPEPLDVNISYEEAVPLMEHLPEYKSLDDEEGRRAAFAKFVKRQKERLREMNGSEDGVSATGRKRKEPYRDGERDHDDRRERDREHRDRDRDRDGRSSRSHRYDDYDSSYRSSRDYRDRERDGDRDRDRERSSKHGHHREEKDDRKRNREKSRDRKRDWDAPPSEDDREKKDAGEKMYDERADSKRPRYDAPEPSIAMDVDKVRRAESPEEGEI